jgi:hypothetical protein
VLVFFDDILIYNKSWEGIENQQQVFQILKDNLTMAQNRMKQQAYQHHSERSFEVGDWVF